MKSLIRYFSTKLPDKELCPKCKDLQEVKCVDESDQKVIRCCKCGYAVDWLYKEDLERNV